MREIVDDYIHIPHPKFSSYFCLLASDHPINKKIAYFVFLMSKSSAVQNLTPNHITPRAASKYCKMKNKKKEAKSKHALNHIWKHNMKINKLIKSMENHIWKHNAKLPITIYEEHWSLSCTVLSLIYSNIKKGACQFATITLFLAPHKKHQSKAHWKKERKKFVVKLISLSLSLWD